MKKRKHPSRFKFQVVLDSYKRDEVVEIARQNNINVNTLSKWRKQFNEHGHEIFETNLDQEKQQLRKRGAELERLIGHKEVEIKLLQNFFTHYESGNGKL
jgi:transposase-like protein